ncbi:WecB/TagA/CpsF family glycosyltransferase [Paenarthrobacter sp. NPDC089322]|uniref:WecB/TagA/CpsF family glycosyltransferase n=1 Tax=Paenarthrobacter sp. NPDC089322 TaxID=3155065 RepID=UPI0034224D0B
MLQPRIMPSWTVPAPVSARARQWVGLGGVPVKLMEFQDALQEITARAGDADSPPLGVCSANLDHILHFGAGGRWNGAMEAHTSVEWLTLVDGAPLVAQAARLTGRQWPRLAGSDLVQPLLDEAERHGLTVGFLGGSERAQELIRDRFALDRPNLQVVGWWAPERAVISDERASLELAARIAEAAPDILVVGFGKPRQELWISTYGHRTGAKVLLAFGAVVDFLAGHVRRAPRWIQSHGLEWAWRLMLEPRRLARRYLVDGPEAYLRLRRDSSVSMVPDVGVAGSTYGDSQEADPGDVPTSPPNRQVHPFLPASADADVAVVVVTYNNSDDVGPLISSLRRETADQTMKVVVADNSPDDRTLAELANHADVIAVSTGGNLGYAGGINAGMRAAGKAGAYLVLNPDLRLESGAVAAMRRRMRDSGAGVVVPALLDYDGSIYPSLRREPSVTRALGDAAFGSRLPGRPGWLSEMDFDDESYRYPHTVDWATGAALLISEHTASTVGDWDEQFFLYSEETDFCRRARQAGHPVWFEPRARMWHERGGSGTSPQLTALLSVNRVRYAAKHQPRGRAWLFRAAVCAAEVARLSKPGHREAAAAVMDRRRWSALPHATQKVFPEVGLLSGAVIIPAHNEATVIARALDSLKPVIETGTVDVIVACNGCTDDTESIASRYSGVKVLTVPVASKIAALNAADRATDRWPRLYLDADIELSPLALRDVFLALKAGPLLAARPAFRYDTSGASRIVRSYYRARNRIPGNAQGLWGAGAYGLSFHGHARLGEFPALTGDDLHVDQLFQPDEKAVLATEPVVVRTPRTAGDLLAVLRRGYRGNAEHRAAIGPAASPAASSMPSSVLTLVQLMHATRGPVSALDALVYMVFAVLGRRGARRAYLGAGSWERDESSRG